MRRYLIASTLAVAVLLPGTAGAEDAPPADLAAIKALWESYSAAWIESDPDAWLALWDEGGVQMPPGAPARGVETLREAVSTEMASESMASFNIHPADIVVSDDWAWSRGTYDLKGEAKGEPYHVDGKFLTILKRQADGSWKIYRDAFNSNVP